MSKLPLCSSEQVVAVLKRLGFKEARTKRGSHHPFYIKRKGCTYSVTVVMGKREIPRGTLRAILDRAGISDEEFLLHLR